MITIVLPLYRNEAALPELVTRLAQSLNGQSFEIVGVDDASPDQSADLLARSAAAKSIPCTIVRHAHNMGQHSAILSGLQKATGACHVIMDADLQDPPESVPLLIEVLMNNELQMVFGRRRSQHERIGTRFTSFVFKRAILKLLNSTLPPEIGTFIAIRSNTTRKLLGISAEHPHIPSMLLALNLPAATLDYDRFKTSSTTSGYTFSARLRLGIQALSLARKLKQSLPET